MVEELLELGFLFGVAGGFGDEVKLLDLDGVGVLGDAEEEFFLRG